MKTDRNIKTLILILCLGTVAISAKASDKDIVDTAVSAGSFNAPPQTRNPISSTFTRTSSSETKTPSTQVRTPSHE